MTRKVVAIGLDAAESSLVSRWIQSGSMPFLARLLERGSWSPVSAPSDIGSGSVWPTFMTEQPPTSHGICSEWTWDPERMKLGRTSWSEIEAFWLKLCDEGRSVATLDVPFSTARPHPCNLQVSDWGAHDWTSQEMSFPTSVAPLVRQAGEHPFRGALANPNGPEDDDGLRRLTQICVDGAKQRGLLTRLLIERFAPDLTISVFGEIHRAAHYLWSSVDPSHRRHRPDPSDLLLSVFATIDNEIRLISETAGSDTELFVFSLHGMRPAEGVSTLLESLLPAAGWARRPEVTLRSRLDAGKAVAALKRLVPAPLKRLYYRTIPRSVTFQLAQPIMETDWDWSATRAIPLPSDQHGWIRINLAGREKAGIVAPAAYHDTCAALRDVLLGLETPEGIPLVDRVLLTGDESPPARLPDLVVHWNSAAENTILRVKEPKVEKPILGANLTGQHRDGGFCITPPTFEPPRDGIDAAALGAVLSRRVRDAASSEPRDLEPGCLSPAGRKDSEA